MPSIRLLLVLCALLTVFAVAPAHAQVFSVAWGDSGTADGQFNTPLGIAVDSSGNVFVTDFNNGRYQKFDNDGLHIQTVTTGVSALVNPYGIAISSSGNVFLLDVSGAGDPVQVLSNVGVALSEFGATGTGPGMFFANHLAIGQGDAIYLVDVIDDTVEEWDPLGFFVQEWGSSGSGPGQFDFGLGIATDGAGNIYVTDFTLQRIQKFTANGTYVTEWPVPSVYGVDVSPSGMLYATIVDSVTAEVAVFDTTGVEQDRFGSQGPAPNQFLGPVDVAVDADENVFVVDSSCHCVKKWTLGGPDLTVDPLSAPVPGPSLDDVTVTATIRNVGGLQADAFLVDARLSPDSVVTVGDPIVGSVVVGSLPSSSDTVITFVIDVSTISTIDGRIWVGVDRDMRIGELVEDNNTAEVPLGGPDLSVISVASPSPETESSEVSVSATVSNLGTLTASAFIVQVQLSEDSVVTGADPVVASVVVGNVGGMADTSLSFLVDVAGISTADGRIAVTADPDDRILETDEGNNSSINSFVYPVPIVFGLADVPDDEGGQLYLGWFASPLDLPSGGGLITEYTIWRGLDLFSTHGEAASREATFIEPGVEIPRVPGSVIRLESSAGPLFWELITNQAAYHVPNYAKIVPTVFNLPSSEFTFYRVIAHTADPLVFYSSNADSAQSSDDLAPAPPANVSGDQTAAEEITISWDPNTEPDLAKYHVYRGTDPGFIADAGSRIGSPTMATLTDPGWTWDGGFYYKVTAVDVHDNESLVTTVGPSIVTGVGDGVTPRVTALDQNRPNPFNPTTTIRYELAQASDVTLRIFDARGSLVRELVADNKSAGRYSVEWDARNRFGKPVAAGVYFYRLTAGTFVETRKMVLVK